MKRRRNFRTMVWAAVAAVALLSLSAGADAVQGDKKIRMYDDCEPTTFNAVLEATQDAHAWRNQPSAMQIKVGRPTFIENRGGETHTFTPVANFGGGFVNELNGISGNPVPPPECLHFGAIVFIPAGGAEEGPTAGSSDLPVGSHKFQCCIHPWMRTVIDVADPKSNGPAAPAAAKHDHH